MESDLSHFGKTGRATPSACVELARAATGHLSNGRLDARAERAEGLGKIETRRARHKNTALIRRTGTTYLSEPLQAGVSGYVLSVKRPFFRQNHSVKELTFPEHNYSQGGFQSKRRTRKVEHCQDKCST
jgi:hypothetical protein